MLARHGGIREPADTDPLPALAANARGILADQIRSSMSVNDAAQMLGISASRVRHRIRDHAPYGFKLGSSMRLPRWQFHQDGQPLPGLRGLLDALPETLHPLEVAGFMTGPDSDLVIGGTMVSPRHWLTSGGDLAAVVALARDLDTW